MRDQHMILLIFAPAVVGLIVAALRRASSIVYWTGMLGVIAVVLIAFGGVELVGTSISPMAFVIPAVIVPTILAFIIGRRLLPAYGGAQIFAGASAAYLLALALAVGTAMLILRIAP